MDRKVVIFVPFIRPQNAWLTKRLQWLKTHWDAKGVQCVVTCCQNNYPDRIVEMDSGRWSVTSLTDLQAQRDKVYVVCHGTGRGDLRQQPAATSEPCTPAKVAQHLIGAGLPAGVQVRCFFNSSADRFGALEPFALRLLRVLLADESQGWKYRQTAVVGYRGQVWVDDSGGKYARPDILKIGHTQEHALDRRERARASFSRLIWGPLPTHDFPTVGRPLEAANEATASAARAVATLAPTLPSSSIAEPAPPPTPSAYSAFTALPQQMQQVLANDRLTPCFDIAEPRVNFWIRHEAGTWVMYAYRLDTALYYRCAALDAYAVGAMTTPSFDP